MMINVGKVIEALKEEIKMIDNDIASQNDETYESLDTVLDLMKIREGICNAIKIIEDLVDEELNNMESEYKKEHGE